MDVRQIGDRECIACGKCMDSCAQGAISLRGGKIVLKGPDIPQIAGPEQKKKRRIRALIVRGVLPALLAFAVVWFNFIDIPGKPSDVPAQAVVSPAEEWTSDAPVGFRVGEQLADFSCTPTDGSTFSLAETRGKIVLINQWATYCTPCIEELPLFEQLQETRPDVVVLAFHTWPELSPDAAGYIAEKGWESWQIRFTADTESNTLLNVIGGDTNMPRTVVLNRRGEVVFNEVGRVSPETLNEQLEKAESSLTLRH